MKRTLAVLAGFVIIAILIWRPPTASAPVTDILQSPAPKGKHARRFARSFDSASATDTVVYVAGAVSHPGLYHLRPGARADDAVRSAGGFLAGADSGAINLAAHVADGDEVYVAVLGAPTPHPARSRRSRQPRKKTATGAVVDLNAATAQELATIPGIGATLAARIVEVRERDGAYGTFDELLDVAGMTSSRLTRAEPYLRI